MDETSWGRNPTAQSLSHKTKAAKQKEALGGLLQQRGKEPRRPKMNGDLLGE
jgi:hypothetical protein